MEVALRPSRIIMLGTTAVFDWGQEFEQNLLCVTGGEYPLCTCPVAVETQSSRPDLPEHGIFIPLGHDLPGIHSALLRRDPGSLSRAQRWLRGLPPVLFSRRLTDGGVREPGRVAVAYHVIRRGIRQAVLRAEQITGSERAAQQIARCGWRRQGRDPLDVVVLSAEGATGTATAACLLPDLARWQPRSSRLVVLFVNGGDPPDAKREALANAAGLWASLALQRESLGDTYLLLFGFEGPEERHMALARSARLVANLLATPSGEAMWGQIVNGLARHHYVPGIAVALVGGAGLRVLVDESREHAILRGTELALSHVVGDSVVPAGMPPEQGLPSLTVDGLMNSAAAYFGLTPRRFALKALEQSAGDLPEAMRVAGEQSRRALSDGALHIDSAPDMVDELPVRARKSWLAERAARIGKLAATADAALTREIAGRAEAAREDWAYWETGGSRAPAGLLGRLLGQHSANHPHAVDAQVRIVQVEALRAALPAVAEAVTSAGWEAEGWVLTAAADLEKLLGAHQLAVRREQEASTALVAAEKGDAYGMGLAVPDELVVPSIGLDGTGEDALEVLARGAGDELLRGWTLGNVARHTPEEVFRAARAAVERKIRPLRPPVFDVLSRQPAGAARFLREAVLTAARPKVQVRRSEAMVAGTQLDMTIFLESSGETIGCLSGLMADLVETGEALVFQPTEDRSAVFATTLIYAVPVEILSRLGEWATAWMHFDRRGQADLHTPVPWRVDKVRRLVSQWAENDRDSAGERKEPRRRRR